MGKVRVTRLAVVDEVLITFEVGVSFSLGVYKRVKFKIAQQLLNCAIRLIADIRSSTSKCSPGLLLSNGCILSFLK